MQWTRWSLQYWLRENTLFCLSKKKELHLKELYPIFNLTFQTNYIFRILIFRCVFHDKNPIFWAMVQVGQNSFGSVANFSKTQDFLTSLAKVGYIFWVPLFFLISNTEDTKLIRKPVLNKQIFQYLITILYRRFP